MEIVWDEKEILYDGVDVVIKVEYTFLYFSAE
jgi:hypothetical protein